MTDTPPPLRDSESAATPADRIVTTKHTVSIGGREISYTAHCGTMVLREEAEKKDQPGASDGHKPKAEIFFVAYLRDGVEDLRSRPITFSFNGGPGSSSVWLHLGVLGPKRVEMGDVGQLLSPPYGLIDNEHSLLDETDLVFIDPVGTGYSRAVVGEAEKQFHNFTRDIHSVGDFIRLFCTRQLRWKSPKFLIGESYGTLRSAALSEYLQDRHGMFLNGLMLVSSVLNFGTLNFGVHNDWPYVFFLPTYTATAWYHGKLDAELQRDLPAAVQAAREFARGEYAAALLAGDTLSDAERAAGAAKLARFSGLSVEFCERADLRIEISRFCKELLRAQGRTAGRLDSRFTGFDRDRAGENPEYDPSMSAIMGPYTAALYDYVRGELGFESDLTYDILSFKTHANWSYKEFEDRYVDASESLRKAMCNHPQLRVIVLNGYYDLATPFFATEYTFSHLGLPPELRGNISMRYYEAGHMMYVHAPSLAQMKLDLAAFVRASR
jgi:carboxypeptidase C (cathepsin A)